MDTLTMVKPLIKVERLEMVEDPTFEAGSTHVAKATLTNPTAKEFTYTLDLYLDVLKLSEATGDVTIPAGGSRDVDFTLIMPSVEGEYEGWLDVWVAGVTEPIEHYKLTENVIIEIGPAIIIGPITWE